MKGTWWEIALGILGILTIGIVFGNLVLSSILVLVFQWAITGQLFLFSSAVGTGLYMMYVGIRKLLKK